MLSGSGLASHLGLGSIFGFDSSSSSSLSSSSSSQSTASLPSATSKSGPQNWTWYTFYDPAGPVGCLWDSASKPISSDQARVEYRAYLVVNYPLFTVLFRSWVTSLHHCFIEESQPLTYGMLVAIQRGTEFMSSSASLASLQELEAALARPIDRFADGRFEMEKRAILERWISLEHVSFSPTGNVFQDASMKQRGMDLVKEAALFAKASGSGSSFASLLSNLKEDLELIFSLAHDKVEAEIGVVLADAESAARSSRAAAPNALSLVSSRSAQRLTDEQKQLLREGKLRMDRSGIGYSGDIWDKPVSSSESWLVLWLLFRLSLLLGLAQHKPGGTKTFFNLRPLGRKMLLWSVLVLFVGLWIVSRLGKLDLSWLDFADDDDE
jgi:hypothetical protein